jgi:hypothetical protein
MFPTTKDWLLLQPKRQQRLYSFFFDNTLSSGIGILSERPKRPPYHELDQKLENEKKAIWILLFLRYCDDHGACYRNKGVGWNDLAHVPG